MSLFPLDTIKLDSIPNIKFLLLNAAMKRSSYDPQRSVNVTLPETKFCFEGVELNGFHSKHFHQVVGWEHESDCLHPCYLHSIAFPMHIKLLLLPEFPFPLLGLVHINNQITQKRPIQIEENLSVSSCFEQLQLHPKGWLFSIKVEFFSGSEVVWQSISTNLFLTKHGQEVKSKAEGPADTLTYDVKANWLLKANLGRRYAKVSGDYNPIHLSKWSARLFGFRQHIVHGMWTKSYCISALQKTNPNLFKHAYEVNAAFKQPLYLPSEVELHTQTSDRIATNEELYFKVLGNTSFKGQLPLHLKGYIRSI
jgi:acyl dehydratase